MMKKKFIQDLEDIFEKSMKSGKFSVALKAKEILGKLMGLIGAPKSEIKPIEQWSEEELTHFIRQLEHILKEE
jgi:hypothetical protein